MYGRELNQQQAQARSPRKIYYDLKNFFGGVNKQKRTETITMADGKKVKRKIETQIPFAASVKVEAKESEIVKTHECMHCGVSFARENGLVLHTKANHRKPDKVSVHTIHGVRTANMD